jgi:hypothetical protein
MKSKPMPPVAEVVCSFKTVHTAPLSPFVWALLKTLKVFKSGERPDWERLATKLAIGEASFLCDGWKELLSNNLADHSDFAVSEISDEGDQALKDGFIRIGEPRCRNNEVLYFRLNNGDPINWKKDFKAKNHSELFSPKWGNHLNEQLIRTTLEMQRESPQEHIQEDEKIFDLEIHWKDSSRVILD